MRQFGEKDCAACILVVSKPFVQSLCSSLLSVPTGTEKMWQFIYNQYVRMLFWVMSECGGPSSGPSAVSECGGIAIVILRGKMRRNGRWSLGWVKMRRPERHKISHGIAAATGLQRTVRSCRGTIQAIFATFPAATGLSRPVPSCRGRISGELSVLSSATGL